MLAISFWREGWRKLCCEIRQVGDGHFWIKRRFIACQRQRDSGAGAVAGKRGISKPQFIERPGDGTGVVRIGVYRPSNATWYLDMNNNGTWDGGGTGVDTSFVFGLPGSNDVPVFGDWNGTGVTKVGIFRNGTWYLDLNNNHAWDPGVDGTFFYGQPGDLPIVSNWNGQGTGDQIGVFRNGTWFVDNNGDGVYPLTGTLDAQYVFGQAGDIPVVGNWDGLGRKRIGVFRGNGLWFLDSDGSNSWTPGTDAGSVIPIVFGQTGDKPIIGTWTMPPMLLP